MAGRLFQRVQALVGRFAGFGEPPPRTADERAVYDAWLAAVKPRAGGLRRRAERLANLGLWELDAERRPDILRPSAWPEVVREVASMAAETSGALAQHARVRFVWRERTRFGMQRGANAPLATTKDKAKARAAAQKAAAAAREAQGKAAKRILADATKRLAAVRTALRDTLHEVRDLAAALTEAEEARLAARVGRLKAGTKPRARAEDLLLSLHQARLEASRHPIEGGAAAWGSLLRRRWLQPRGTLVRLVEGP